MRNRLKTNLPLILIGLIFAPSLFAAEAGKFISLEGKVDLIKPGLSKAAAVSIDEPLTAGDIIRTKGASKAEIKFTDNTILRMAENSRIELKEFDVENKRRIAALIYIDRGQIRTIVSRPAVNNDLRLETANAVVVVKGADLFITYEKSMTGVLVADGRASVVNKSFPDKREYVTGGNTLIVPADEPPQQAREFLALEKKRYETATTSPSAKTLLAAEGEKKISAISEGYSAPGEMKAIVTKVSGSVRAKNRGSKLWHDAKVEESLYEGDTIETKENGRIQIRLDNNNIINLKPGSLLFLKKLSEDPATGDYENLIFTTRGLIRSKVGKLRDRSKFEIRTPTAVASVRGTTMYLRVTPALTASYFTEGNGYLRDIISGIFKIVPAGRQSSADGKGNVSDPTEPTESERKDWESGWDTEEEAEGYSTPESTPQIRVDAINFNLADTNALNPPFSSVPITDQTGFPGTGGGSSDGQPTAGEEETFTGRWGDTNPTLYYRSGRLLHEGGSTDGFISSNFPQWSDNGVTFELTAAGSYSDFADSEPYLWQTPVLSFNSVSNNQKTSDGGAFIGRTIGIWNAGLMKNGKMRLIYLSPAASLNTYNAGILKGDLSGEYQPVPDSSLTGGVWTADGILAAEEITRDVMIDPAAFDDFLSMIDERTFTGTGNGKKEDSAIFGGVLGNTFNLTGQNWGVWQMASLGSAPNNASTNWRLALGGTAWEDSGGVHGYFLGTIAGSDWSNGELEGVFRGISLRQADPEGQTMTIGSMTGDAVGTYVDTTWHAREVGEWIELAQLDTGPGGIGFDKTALAQLVSVPVTETFSSLLTGSGTLGASGIIANAHMDISFYAAASNALNGIWAALINGNYTNPSGTAATGAISFTDNSGTAANLTNLRWNGNNTWIGNVNGTTADSATFEGQAGGTYTGQTEGTLQGAGAGTWTKP